MTSPMDIGRIAVLCVAALACISDLRARRIPNILTFGAAFAAIIFRLSTGGLSALAEGLAGWATGAALFFPFFILRGMGGGDVKLLAAFGAWLGPMGAVWTALYAGVVGGVLGLAVALAHGYARQALTNVWTLVGYWRISGFKPLPELTLQQARGPRLAYAVPLAAGAMLTLWWH